MKIREKDSMDVLNKFILTFFVFPAYVLLLKYVQKGKKKKRSAYVWILLTW